MKVLIDDFYEVVLALEDVSGTVCWPVREWCISWILGSVCASVPRYLWSQCWQRLRECSALLVESVTHVRGAGHGPLRLLGCVSCTSLLSS